MIKIIDLSVKFSGEKILDNFSYQFPDKGLITIIGKSGCGKTTLLNCLNGLQSYEGTITFSNITFNSLCEKEKQLFRAKNFGMIYQDFNLYNTLTVKETLSLQYKLINLENKNNENNKINEVLSETNILNLSSKKISNLSGGERQRVAIARAIINNPKVIYADEPTGSLDLKNTNEIFDLLRKISAKTLVIVVTHDLKNAIKYSNKVLYLEAGHIVHEDIYDGIKNNSINRLKVNLNRNETKLDNKIIAKYSTSKFKPNKLKTGLSLISFSLAMICIGFTLSISTIIKSTIKSSYGSLFSNENVVLSLDNTPSIVECSKTYEEVLNFSSYYEDKIDYIGVCYKADFESIFEDANYATFVADSKDIILPGITARSINDFLYIENNENIFPELDIDTLNDCDVILNLTFGQIKYICEKLNIKQSIESLGEYIKKNNFSILMKFANYSWEYEDEQLLEVKGVKLSSVSGFSHINTSWNEYMFENRMRLPTKDNNYINYEPWRLFKIYYYKIFDKNADFLKTVYSSSNSDNFLFEIANSSYFSSLIYSENKNINKLLIFDRPNGYLLPRIISYIDQMELDLKNPIYGTKSGYLFLPEYFMSGFSNVTYITGEEEKLLEIVDLYDYLNEDEKGTIISDGVLCGHYSKSYEDGISFVNINNSSIMLGDEPSNYDEIVVSSKMAKYLFDSFDCIGKKIYIGNNTKTSTYNGKTRTTFATTSLTITGIVDKDKYQIYSDTFWSILFFQSNLGISAFDLLVNSIAYEHGDTYSFDKSKTILEEAFPKTTLTNPSQDVINNVDEVDSYLEVFLFILTILISIISMLLLLLVSGLYISDIKKDIGIARCVGVSKKESRKFAHIYFYLLFAISFIISSIELILLSFFLSTQFGVNDILSVINPLSFLAMFLLGLIFSSIISFYASKITDKLNTLECIRK